MNKVRIVKTTEGYMVELPNGDYLCDEHGDNTWETRGEAENAVAINYVDLNNYIDYGNVKPRRLHRHKQRWHSDNRNCGIRVRAGLHVYRNADKLDWSWHRIEREQQRYAECGYG